MAEEKPVDQLSSQELFASATAGDPETPPAEPTPPPAEPPAPAEPPKEPPAPEPPPAAAEPPQVPPWRLREESEARRLAEDRARVLEERLQQIATHLQQQQKQPDFFENPDQATQTLIMRTLQPYADETRKTLMHMSKMVAEARHGSDKVDSAEQAFLKAREEQVLDTADYERVVQAPNRYDAVVKWHKRQSVLSSVGDDPAAWFDKQLEAKMADPKFQATLLERVRTSAASKPGAVQLPPSLSRAPAAQGNGPEPVGDLSDQSLFAFATKR